MCESGQDSERNAGTQKKEGTQGLVLRKVEIFKGIFETCQGVVTNFEIFRMREKQVPVDVVEMKGEDRGKHSSVRAEQKPDVPFASLFSRKHHSICLGTQ